MLKSFRDMPDQEADELSAQIEAVSSPRTFTPSPADSATTQLIARLPVPDTLSDQETAPSQKTCPDNMAGLLGEEDPAPATEPEPLPAPPVTTAEQSLSPPVALGEEPTVLHEEQGLDRAFLESADTLPARAFSWLIPASGEEDSIFNEMTQQMFVSPSAETAPDDILSAVTQPLLPIVLPPTGQFAVVAAPPLPPVSPRKLVRAAAFGAGIFICGALFGAFTLGRTYYSNRTTSGVPQPIAAAQTAYSPSQQVVRVALQPPLPCPAPVAPTSAKAVLSASSAAPSKPTAVRTSVQRIRKPTPQKATNTATPPPAFVPPQPAHMTMGDYVIQTGPTELPGVAKNCGLSSANTILNLMPNSKMIEDAKTAGTPILPPGTIIRVPCSVTGLEPLIKSGRFRPLFQYTTTSLL